MSKEEGSVLIRNGRIVTEDGIIENGSLLLEDGRIAWMGDADAEGAPTSFEGETVDAQGSYLLPGFIDIHVHGGGGSDFMDATPEALDAITGFHAKQGTTAMLSTPLTNSYENLTAAVRNTAEYMASEMPYAQILGVHLEGPFFNVKWKGAQNPKYIVPPSTEWLEEWNNAYPGVLKIVTLAPEIEGATQVIEWLTAQGIVASAGHTDASYDVVSEATRHGLCHAVHTYNAMTPLHHRNPGTVGAVMTHDAITAEIIADGIHVHPAAVKVLVKTKGTDRVILITDAMSAAGLGDGSYSLGGLSVTVRNGQARLTEGDSLAGSILTMIEGFRFLVNQVGVSVQEASRMASGNPARRVGAADRIGSLAVGKQADVLLVSPELELQRSWIKGRPFAL
ncbi:N-acetylglucosamine-6-phosphate deacetylase [Paenibacillus sp. J31TS4]|uniref:N-acetylglucosamine-6-phosphate deacetylase n=1 Tax=Paenibacillus sp. J31TS4 TaxID=2807195 RepID=UPI001B1DEE20|nr:N-acetylglucosamine-6-phosphate deacetylase [Paenibacillus sp. J31TS4]GIP37253.1 N-acetylglucosamine-6-phosphate deacetylase [Paenibacillus sp. J31TS4]